MNLRTLIFIGSIAGMFLADRLTSYVLFFACLALSIGIGLSWFFAPFIDGNTSTKHTPKEPFTIVKDSGELPIDYAKWTTVNKNIRQVSFKDKSFAVWKTPDGKVTKFQEINPKNNLPIGKVMRGTAKDVTKHIKDRFKEV